MIAVVADDFAGAAEVAGAAFSLGLAAEVCTQLASGGSADLIAIDTDTRRLPAAQAAAQVASTAAELLRNGHTLLFKKVDSILRGPVLDEVRAILAATGKRRAVLAAANPSRRRIIRGGRYFIDGRPLDQTAFASDPERPAKTSDVLELLGASHSADVCLRRHDEDLPPAGIIVAEVASTADLRAWAARLDPETLAAGAADVLEAILRTRECVGPQVIERPGTEVVDGPRPPPVRRTLLVCGSAVGWASGRGEQCMAAGIPIVFLADEAAGSLSENALGEQTRSTLAALEARGIAMLTLGRLPRRFPASPHRLLGHLADVVACVVRPGGVDRLWAEGGATAAAVVRRLGWTRLAVVAQLCAGVVSLCPTTEPRMVMTVKPGSYPWPAVCPMVSGQA